MEETHEKEICCIDKNSREYPKRMKNLPDMPDKLYYIGRLPSDDIPTAAIVGARNCSIYGRVQAFSFAKALSSAGVQVISGLAGGIDAEGHKGALEGSMPTFAVMGNGVDICYPKSGRGTYRRILQEGGIISEYPPGTSPRAYFFPARNRIISALSDVVLVVEAREKSGSLITAGYALEQGKAVYAVPGAVGDALSLGCHKLIYDGAGIAFCPEIILEEWGISPEKEKQEEKNNQLVLASDLDLVYSCLDLRPQSLEYIIQKTGFSAAKTSSLLMELELMGLAGESAMQFFRKA